MLSFNAKRNTLWGIAHADFLSSYRKRKTLRGIKTSPSAFLMSTCCLTVCCFLLTQKLHVVEVQPNFWLLAAAKLCLGE
jgi:Flp pilus assembly protein TadB